MSDDFEREALNNPHVHAAVQAGVDALRCKFPDANIGNTLSSEISVTVVEAVRSSVYREAAADLYEMSEYGLSDILKAKAGELDRQYRQRHQSPSDAMLATLKADYLKLETDHKYVFRDRGEDSE